MYLHYRAAETGETTAFMDVNRPCYCKNECGSISGIVYITMIKICEGSDRHVLQNLGVLYCTKKRRSRALRA